GSGSLAQSLPLIGGERVHTLGFTGRGVTVALLDTGVDLTHPDLAGRILDEHCFCRNSDGTGCRPNRQNQQGGAGAAADAPGRGTAAMSPASSARAGWCRRSVWRRAPTTS